MEIVLDTSTSTYQIRSYEPGKIIINEDSYSQSVILTPQRLIHPWAPQSLKDLTTIHFNELLKLSPQVILFGSGPSLIFPSQELLTFLWQQKQGIEVMDTSAACRTFNVLAAEGRNVAAALLIN